MSSDEVNPEDIEFFQIPDSENVDEWIVDTYRTETMTKFKKAVVATAMINDQLANKGAANVHDAAERVQNVIDTQGWAMRTMESDRKALVDYDEEWGTNFTSVLPGQEVVLPDDEQWKPKVGGRNHKFADYRTLDALKKALPDGPRVIKLKKDKEGNVVEMLHRVANKETEGWDRYVFHEATHEWIPEGSYIEAGSYDFKTPEDLAKKYPIGYHLNKDGEVTDDAKTFKVKSGIKGHEDFTVQYTWKQPFSLDLVDPEDGSPGWYEDECSWVRETVFSRDQVWNEITYLGTQMAQFEQKLEFMFLAQPNQMAEEHDGALELLDFCKMQLEVIEQMLKNGADGHIAFNAIVAEVRDHLAKPSDEREQDWDAGLAKLLSEMENRDDGDQS